jgi:ATP-dependent exoDNAse (exonuclease V) beta subunit
VPLGCHAGAIDLLYRDPESGGLVVADFKTDRVETPAELIARAAVYHPQEALYARAVQEMTDAARPPRTELWFLWADTVIDSGRQETAR